MDDWQASAENCANGRVLTLAALHQEGDRRICSVRYRHLEFPLVNRHDTNPPRRAARVQSGWW